MSMVSQGLAFNLILVLIFTRDSRYCYRTS